MTKIEGLKINEAETELENGKKGKIAVFLYTGKFDPKPILDYAVKQYVGNYQNYIELVDAQMDYPWVRVVISDVNDMKQENFNNYMLRKDRMRKIEKINSSIED